MIDITIDKDTVQVEMKVYYFDYARKINNQAEMVLMLKDIIEKAKFSGETVTLWKVEGEEKILQGEWH